MISGTERVGSLRKVSVVVCATAYFAYYAWTPSDWHFIDTFNLLIHEAGHIIFSPFGEFLYILGGSLFQIVFPVLYIVYFAIKQQYFSASLLVFWVGQNIINVSVYAADARVMQLSLLGGDSSTHDWNALLTMTNLLPYTDQIGFCLYIIGVFVILFASTLSLYSAVQPDLVKTITSAAFE